METEAEAAEIQGQEPGMQTASGSRKRQGSGFSPGASRRNARLMTHVSLLTSRPQPVNLCCVVLSHRVGADVLQKRRVVCLLLRQLHLEESGL